MKIPQFDLTRQYEQIEPEIQSAIRHVLRGGQFILGAEGEAFEAECAAYLGVKPRDRSRLGVGRDQAGSPRARRRPRHRGGDPGVLVRRLRHGCAPARSPARVRRHRSGDVRSGPGPRLGRHHAAHAGDPGRAPLRAARRHGSPPGAVGGARGPPRGGRRPGVRRDLGRPPRRRARSRRGVQLLPHEEPRGLRRRRARDDHGRRAGHAPPPGAEPRADAEVPPCRARMDRAPGRAPGGHPPGETPTPAGVDPGATGSGRPLQQRARRAPPGPARGAARRHARVPPVHDSHAPTRCARRASGGRRHRHRLPLSAAHPRPADVPRSRLRRELVSGGMGRRPGGALAPLLPGASAR